MKTRAPGDRTGRRPAPGLREAVLRAGLLLVSVSFACLSAELAMRLWLGSWTTENLVVARRDRWHGAPRLQFDPMLGWIPTANQSTRARRWGDVPVTTLEDGLRSNGTGQPPTPERPLVIAVGDSFTFGDEVGDGDTWPARLERSLGVRVLNGGVSAYGLDQTILRGLFLAERHRPELLVVSFIDEDASLRVASCTRDDAYKPCFVIVDGEPTNLAKPVPPPGADLDPVRRWLGYSVLLDYVASRRWPEYWLIGVRSRVNDDPLEVSCRLLQRLRRESEAMGVAVSIVAQAGPTDIDVEAYPAMARCAAAEGIPYLDLHAEVRALQRTDPERFRSMYRVHMTAAGNAWVGRRVAEFVRDRRLLPPR